MKDREGINSREAGIALTAHPDLKIAVNIVCSVRRKKTGTVTKLVRVGQLEDKEEQVATRKRKAEEKDTNNIRLKQIKAAKLDKAEHTVAHELVVNSRELEIQLAARLNSKQSQLTFLKEQFNARVNSDLKRTYTTIDNAYRKRGGGLRISSEDPKQQLSYLTDLLKLMIQEDQDTLGINSRPIHTSNHEFLLFLPSISKAYSNPKVQEMKDKFEGQISALATPIDDPVYVQLAGQYMGAILYDLETRASWKLYRVSAIQFIRSYSSHRSSCWEATCDPFTVMPKQDNSLFLMKNMFLTRKSSRQRHCKGILLSTVRVWTKTLRTCHGLKST
jgi:hypothetical protein